MEEKNIFVVTKEFEACGETSYSTVAAFNNLEDAKKKMKEVSKEDMSWFKEHINNGHIDNDDINIEEEENSIFVSVNFEGEYSYIQLFKTTLY